MENENCGTVAKIIFKIYLYFKKLENNQVYYKFQ